MIKADLLPKNCTGIRLIRSIYSLENAQERCYGLKRDGNFDQGKIEIAKLSIANLKRNAKREKDDKGNDVT